MNIVFLGAPGAGKGTQARRLAADYHLVHLSTGDAFREAISQQTPLGLEIKDLVENGRLVPDELVSRVVFDKIDHLGGKGFLLDGYPRTLEQARALTKLTETSDVVIDAVLFLEVAFAELSKRLSERRICPKCHKIYSLVTRLPKVEGICDKCGSGLSHRSDDHPEVVQERFAIYKRQTEAILDYYRPTPIFRRIDGAQKIEKVYEDIKRALDELPGKEKLNRREGRPG